MNTTEKLQILQMIENKQITPEEGMKLLEAMEQSQQQIVSVNDSHYAEFIRIRVVEENKTKVNVNLPIALIEAVVQIGTKFLPQDLPELNNIDFKAIIAQVKAGARGKIAQIEDGNSFVEISIE